MQRALLLGQNPSIGLHLHGRPLRLSSAVPGGVRARAEPSLALIPRPPITTFRPSATAPAFRPPTSYATGYAALRQQPEPVIERYGARSQSKTTPTTEISLLEGLSDNPLQGLTAPYNNRDLSNTTVFIGGLPCDVDETILHMCVALLGVSFRLADGRAGSSPTLARSGTTRQLAWG
jgi:hypothetical protein